MYLLGKDEFRTKKDSLQSAYQSVRLGVSTNPLNTTTLTIVPTTPREKLNRGVIPPLVNGYSSFAIDLNPLDIAYRADQKSDYYIDFGSLLVRTAWAASTGGSSEAAKTAARGIFFLFA
jgi:hypothetical protein